MDNSDLVRALFYPSLNFPQEFFMIEYAGNTGRFGDLPGNDFLIWHVDESITDNEHEELTYELHYKVSLEQDL